MYSIKKKHREYEKEMRQSKSEIQESTLNQVAEEWHDNISQKLVFVKLSLQIFIKKINIPDDQKEMVNKSTEIIENVLMEIREMQHSIVPRFDQYSLTEAIKTELDRLDEQGLFKVSFTMSGYPFKLQLEKEISVYRIFQECLTNIIKHAKAKTISVLVQYSYDKLKISIDDDGQGFDLSHEIKSESSGLKNILARAERINGTAKIESRPGVGTSVHLEVTNK